MSSLLLHSEQVPIAARIALRAAHESPPESSPETRLRLLESAARILRDETGVDCPDARELVDLRSEDCGG
jgi:hypothetical protein